MPDAMQAGTEGGCSLKERTEGRDVRASSLGPLVRALGRGLPPGAADADVRGVESDSRRVTSGVVFVAVRGHDADGHCFAAEAARRGAAALVVEEGPLYQELPAGEPRNVRIRMIPYFAWNNRGEPKMTVWIPLL